MADTKELAVERVFRAHVLRQLASYAGNLKFAATAVEKGWIPNTADPAVQPFVQKLKDHLVRTGMAEDDPFVLAIGLVSPGMMRGIHPPMMVLEENRGGLSTKRLREAEGQISRLREVLSIGALLGINRESESVINELARLGEPTISDDEWIEVHAQLGATDAAQLAERGLECTNHRMECVRDLGLEVLGCMSSFRGGLGNQLCRALLAKNIFWPSCLYLEGGAEIATGLLGRIGEAEEILELDHLLRALAWTRHPVAIQAFCDWQSSPPSWAHHLHVPPASYLHESGIGLDQLGRPHSLISMNCFHLAPTTDGPGNNALTIKCRTPAQGLCTACGSLLAWLFDFGELPRGVVGRDDANAPERVLFCHHCANWHPVFSHYGREGDFRLHVANPQPERQADDYVLPVVTRRVNSRCRPPFVAGRTFAVADASSIGGLPMWLQNQDYPVCPDCGNTMTFLAQLDNGSLTPPEEGVYYAFYCSECSVSAVTYQQT